ncbi:MAG: DUF3185 family protein [Opitutus sp.]
MSKLLGLILLVAGSLMLYFGWNAREAVGAEGLASPLSDAGSQAVWLLTLGAVALVWGLAVSIRRRA